MLTYQLNVYQHKQIPTNPTLVVDRGPGVRDTGGCSGSTYTLADAKSSQLILPVAFFASVKTFVGI
jgi:hypothetical protein